ncbi:dihydroneopterin aldolase [Rubrivirga sp. SAORIC476]|nr:dihydroneopterin aldolase [Rubrivirga sp. SAORIC476]
MPPSFSASPVPATVRLVNAVFYAHHGVMEEEHKVGGRFEVDVAMDLDIRQAATDDDLSKTVDYERVYAIVRDRVTGTPSYLIESLAYSIAEVVMQHFPMLLSVEVTVRKPNPPVGGPCDRAEVVYRLDAAP